MIRTSNSERHSSSRQAYQKQYLGNYLGIVVQNNDPSKRGRVKIFVPHLSASVYSNWDSKIADKQFKFIGKNIDSDLTDIIDDLKQILPWAECAAPLAGSSSSGRYHARDKVGTISDSNNKSTIEPVERSEDDPLTKYALNKDEIGEKPARIYEVDDLKVSDAFTTTVSPSGTAGFPERVNKFSHNYVPSSYSNNAKGSFSVPNVGSHVWVFFQGGDPITPVYFATSFGAEDWHGIYDSDEGSDGLDYPGTYENKSQRDDVTYNHNTETYRNKYVFSQKGGTLEFVNTDSREILKMTHFSGSFKEFNNYTTTEFAANNDQKLVQGDQFLTVRGHRSEYNEFDYDHISKGDVYRKIGSFNTTKFKEWRELVWELADLKQLFEVQRTEYDHDDNKLFQKVSPAQKKSPNLLNFEGVDFYPGPVDHLKGHALCPLCSHPNRQAYWNINNNSGLTLGITSLLPSVRLLLDLPLIKMFSALFLQKGFKLEPTPKNPDNFLGSKEPCPVCGGSKIGRGAAGYGYSPSTMYGNFKNQQKDDLIAEKIKRISTQLTTIEKDLGLGGSEIVHITKHKTETVGLVMNEYPSIRIDKVGKMVPSEMRVYPKGVVMALSASPLVEYVHVDDLPGGSYDITACNRFNVLAGAGGVSMKTVGPVDIGGTITNIAGQQVNIASQNEININAKHIEIAAEIIRLRHKKNRQILVEGNLGVNQNVIIGGSCHIEGELSVQHITAPCEVQETEETKDFGHNLPMLIGEVYGVADGFVTGGGSSGGQPVQVFLDGTQLVFGISTPNSVETYKHSHQFKNLPLSLTTTSDGVRKVGQNTNIAVRTPPMPVVHGPKGGGLLSIGESFGED